jgi:hypothetical protein
MFNLLSRITGWPGSTPARKANQFRLKHPVLNPFNLNNYVPSAYDSQHNNDRQIWAILFPFFAIDFRLYLPYE